jgi:probable F420-dependent oxidoreductase
MTPVFKPGPNPYGLPRIFAAGVGPRMTEVVGEVADGFFVHPFHTADFLRTKTLSWLGAGLERSGRTRTDIEVAGQCIIVTGRSDEDFEKARNGARAQISFYGSTPAYRPVLDHMGMGDLQDELNRLSKQGKWLEMAGLIDDDVLSQIAVMAPRDELAEALRKRYSGVVDRLSLVSHTAPDPDLWADVVQALADA